MNCVDNDIDKVLRDHRAELEAMQGVCGDGKKLKS